MADNKSSEKEQENQSQNDQSTEKPEEKPNVELNPPPFDKLKKSIGSINKD